MNKTKKKIILSAIQLFNDHGLANVRNQDIAKQSEISLSNFNYHFKNKKDLVFEVINYMKETLEEKVYGNRMLIETGQGLDIAKSYFEFQEKFQFFYLDTNNIIQAYPELKKGFQIQINYAIQMIKNLNYLAIGKGLMKPEPSDMPNLYDQLAEQIWNNNHFWLAHSRIRDIAGSVVLNGMKMGFAIVYPYLTEKGIASQKAFIENLEKTLG